MLATDFPLYTREVAIDAFAVPSGSSFIYSKTAEEDRAIPSPNWFPGINDAEVAQLPASWEGGDFLTLWNPTGDQRTVASLYDSGELRLLLEGLPQPVYLDITGLPHRVWAPLIKAAHASSADLRVIYLEPEEYLRRSFRDEQRIYDLSTKFEGLRPLPGFVKLEPQVEDTGYFVPMVGFEGARLDFVVTKTDANLQNTFPIVGVPGFRPDYAFFAFQGNRAAFEKEFLQRRVQFAKANCPFDAFMVLNQIHDWSGHAFIRVAPIGTKPHALGAVLYAVAWPAHVDLVYDNPVKARNRTEGQSRVLVYAVSAFMRSTQFGQFAGVP